MPGVPGENGLPAIKGDKGNAHLNREDMIFSFFPRRENLSEVFLII